MLSFQDSKIMQSSEEDVATGFTVTAEGQALVATLVNGVFGVKPSAGTAGENFAGFSLAQQLTPSYLPFVERLTVAGLAVTVANTPQGGTLSVYNVTKAAAVASGASAGNYSISGNVISIVTGGTTVNGDVLEVRYRYSPTTVQVKAIMGDIPPGGAASQTINRVGVIKQGVIYTTEFDTSVDWNNPSNLAIKLSANGLLTLGGSGTTVPNSYITKVPQAGDASGVSYLGLSFSA